jgi:serine/threonine protein kinase
MPTHPTIFISYSREDEDEKEALLTHLRVLAQDRLIDIWSDDQIGVGDTWQREVEQAMARAAVAILLITADYLASSFIQNEQLPKLLQHCKDGGLKIFPVIAKPCAWQVVSWLKQMETRPKHGRAVWRNEGRHAHEDLAEIVGEIEGIVRQNTPDTPNDELIGTFLDKYQLIKLLGQGSAARVYQTYHPGLVCYMAIKVMDSHLMSESSLERFRSEAAAVVGLRHNHIIRVYDFNQARGKHYMVMDLIEGPTLEAKLRERQGASQPFTLAEIIDICDALTDALDYAHSQGVVHHDLKPANIMFTADNPAGQLILTDFGIARIMDAGNQTIAGMYLGTPNYTAPEQAQGQRGDRRSDIYSLGVILYELATGRLPFMAGGSKSVLQQHINVPPPPPSRFNPKLSTQVEQVILKALSKKPADRYQSAGALAASLRQAILGREPQPQQEPNKELNQETADLPPVNPPFNLKELRKKLTLLFDDAEFEAFCLDYFPAVFDKFSRGHRKDEKINLLLDYCRRDPIRYQKLLGLVEKITG